MELYLLRHGHAEPEAPKDRLRELSVNGRFEVKQTVERNLASLLNVQEMIVSPYVRARQSADIFKELRQAKLAAVEHASPTELVDSESKLLVPTGDPQALIAYLHGRFHHDGVQSLLLVGHQPLLGVLLDALVGAEPGRYRLCTASLAALDTEVLAKGCCSVRWVKHVER